MPSPHAWSWLRLSGKLQLLCLAAPASARVLEDIVDNLLKLADERGELDHLPRDLR